MKGYSEEKRQFWVILTIVFLGFIGISIPYVIFPPIFLNHSYSFLPVELGDSSRYLLLGITLAVYPLGQFIGSPILGALSDDYGRKKLITNSLIVSSICYLLTGIAICKQHLVLLIFSRFVAGVMEGNIAIARALASDLKTISKHESFGKINATASIAYLIGPLLGGVMSNKNIFHGLTGATAFFFTCILFIGLAWLSAVVLPKNNKITPVRSQTIWQRINFIKKVSILFLNKRLSFLMIVSTLFTLAVDIFYQFGPVYLTIKWMLGPTQLVIYNGVLCLGLMVGNGWLPGIISSFRSNELSIACSILGFALFLIGIVVADSVVLMILLFGGSGLFIGYVVTLLTVKISDSVSETIQGEVMGTHLSLRVLGDSMICLFGGMLLILSSKIILILAALMSLSSMGYFLFRYKKVFSETSA